MNQYNSSIKGKHGARVIAYDQDEEQFKVFDADGVQLINESLYSTKNNEFIGGVKDYQVHGDDAFVVVTKSMSGGNADLWGGARKKRGRKPRHVLNLSSLSPDVASYFTFQPEVDNQLLQHTSRRFKEAHGIEPDTEIVYDSITGGARKRTRKSSQSRKGAKAAFGMDKEDVLNLTEELVSSQAGTALTFNVRNVNGGGSLYDILNASIGYATTGGVKCSMKKCDCDAEDLWAQMYKENVQEVQPIAEAPAIATHGGADTETPAEPIAQAVVEPPVQAVAETLVNAVAESPAQATAETLVNAVEEVKGAGKRGKKRVKKVEEQDTQSEEVQSPAESIADDDVQSEDESTAESSAPVEADAETINYFS